MSEEKHFIEDVVHMHDLARRTAEGWSVVERVEFDDAIPYTDNYVPAPPTNGGYSDGNPRSINRTALGRAVAFRIRRTADDIVAQLTEQVTQLKANVTKAFEEAQKATKAVENERAGHARTMAQLAERLKENERLVLEHEKTKQAKRLLENDLGKVREHIGRKEFEAIIPPVNAKS